MTKEEIKKIVEECYNKTKIIYTDKGKFFDPKLKSINHLEVGNSKIINSWLTILIEFFIAFLTRISKRIKQWWHRMTPRKDIIYGTDFNSTVVGRITFGKRNDLAIPIHNKRVELWVRTRLFQWRKLSAGRTDRNGYFELPFDFIAARNWWNRANLRFEIYEMTGLVTIGGKLQPNKKLFKTLLIPKSDLIGMSYSLGVIQLFFWEYRDDTRIPRVFIKNHDEDAPEEYTEGRTVSMSEQFIPIELTKQKHLLQIRREPESINLQTIQDDYPENLTVAIEKRLPGYTRGDDWFGERFMNGMSMATFIPDTENPAHYWIKFFGAGLYEVNEEYAFPTAKIKFKLKEDGLPTPIEIRLIGPLNAINKDPYEEHVYTPQDGEKWLQAKRAARVTSALCGEIDQHLAGTHLNTEQYSIAVHRNLRLNPIARLLLPHVKEVALIDHSADKLLIKDYLPNATALTTNSLLQRAEDLLGFQDWKNWQPMNPISEAHTYAKAETLFWNVLREWVDLFVEENDEEIKKYWYEIYLFSKDLVSHSVPLYGSNLDWETLSDLDKNYLKERIEYLSQEYRINFNSPREKVDNITKVISPVTLSEEYNPNSNDWQNLKDMCCYVIMTATFLHTWINEHQYEDIGEVLYSCLGLRFGEKEQGIMSPESDYSIAPDLTRSTQMMWFSNFLSRTEYGFIVKNEDGDMDPRLIEMFLAKKEEFKKYNVAIDQIESRTNI
ncbi:MAG: hypothetical protein JNL75_00930 [Chitinophagales bacterium]|nr:hypothetical protein [Chitinophagales bacterium]